MKKLVIFIFLILVIHSCSTINNKHEQELLQIFLVAPSYENESICIKIEDSVIHKSHLPYGNAKDFFLLLKKIPKIEDSAKVYISVDNRDTTFMYNFHEVDSLIIVYVERENDLNDNFTIWNQHEIRKLDLRED